MAMDTDSRETVAAVAITVSSTPEVSEEEERRKGGAGDNSEAAAYILGLVR